MKSIAVTFACIYFKIVLIFFLQVKGVLVNIIKSLRSTNCLNLDCFQTIFNINKKNYYYSNS